MYIGWWDLGMVVSMNNTIAAILVVILMIMAALIALEFSDSMDGFQHRVSKTFEQLNETQ